MVGLPCFENEAGRRMVVLCLVFAGLILACLARCGFCGEGPFATSTILLRLSWYVSGVLCFMGRWQILATWRLFLGAVHYWPTEGHVFTAEFCVFISLHLYSPVPYLSSFISFTLRFWCPFQIFFPLRLHPSLPALGPTHNGSPVIPKDKTTGAWR
jgi:hypothetical protein